MKSSMSMGNAQAKWIVYSKLYKALESAKNEQARAEHTMLPFASVPGQNRLNFDFAVFDDWLKSHLTARYFKGVGGQEWIDLFLQNVDYLADPSIVRKNQLVVYTFV